MGSWTEVSNQWGPRTLRSQTGPRPSRSHSLSLTHTHTQSVPTPQPRGLTFFLLLLLLLGSPVLVLALLLQDILKCPFGKLLPGWEGKGLSVASLPARLPHASELRSRDDGALRRLWAPALLRLPTATAPVQASAASWLCDPEQVPES